MSDKQQRHALVLLDFAQQVENLRLCGHVQRRGGLVGNQQRRIERQGHGDHHPLALATGEFIGIRQTQPLGVGQADITEQVHHALATFPRGFDPVGTQGLIDLLADAQQRVQRAHRLLEHHADIAPAQFAHRCFATVGQVFITKHQAPAFHRQRRGQLAQQRLGQHRLARTGLAHHTQAFTAAQLQRQVIQRMATVRTRRQGDTQVFDTQ